ncbi:disease resistance protein RPS5-like [Prunus yedoensis var. nudiflora]|uniref:Disease resistance protein RPS5-like n=1 Tax=Prunus yedoensis var. nudiflora TaxID=2094558 RepID=A0A314XQI8_PRUYE|nr:disease resistance protein RPS5-like [Prunus yedoensis var. nudiflora]
MHDIVRDVAISIASKDPHRFMVRSFDAEGGDGGWLGVQKATNQEHYSAISLIDFKLDEDITDGLECQKLELLQLINFYSSEYSNHFKRLLGLKRSLLLGEPKYLHTLYLEDCKLGDISHVIGGLENLEILSFARSQINKLPREIGLLHRLRMLDATDCEGLKEIPHGVLSNLRRLEELYMAESFLNWGPATGSKDETSMASLDEVMSLSDHLNVLAIKIPGVQMLRNDEFLLKSQPIRFHVSINISWSYEKWSFKNQMCGYLFENSLMLRGDVKEYLEIGAVRYFLKQSKDLSLHHTYNLKYVVEELDGQGGFQHLKVLSIMYDKNIEYLMKGIDWTHRSQHPYQLAFPILRSIHIDNCDELKYVFSLSVAQNLVQLQSLKVENCAKVEEIISKERMEDDNASHRITFPRLTILKLFRLPMLYGFYTGNQRDSNYERFCPDAYCFAWSSSMRSMHLRNCPKLKTLGFALVSKKRPAAIAENLSDDHVEGREESGSGCASSTGSGSGFGCAPLVCLQSRPSTRNFTQILPRPVNREVTSTNLQTSSASDNLEDLFINMCNLLEVIFLVQETPSTQAFDKLRELSLWNLRMLSHIWEKGLQVSSGFGNLRSLNVWGCGNLRYLFSPHIAKLLTCLETIYVFNCRAMEKIVGEVEGGGESIEDELTFPHVNSIELWYLPKLESFCSQAYSLKWPALEKVEVNECPKLKAFAPEFLYV